MYDKLHIPIYRCSVCKKLNKYVNTYPTNENTCITCGKSRSLWSKIKYMLSRRKKDNLLSDAI